MTKQPGKKLKKADELVPKKMSNDDISRVIKKTDYNGILIHHKNEGQRKALEVIDSHEISFIYGCPGTGKSFLAIARGLHGLTTGKYKRLVITRPYVEAGEHLGFLPGSFNNKIAPFMYPVMEIASELMDRDTVMDLINDGIIMAMPLAYMRGATFRESFIVCDEAQNMRQSQMRMLLTRIGSYSKMVITGDTNQSDLYNATNGLVDALKRLDKIDEIGFHEMKPEDCVRSGIVAKIESCYRENE